MAALSASLSVEDVDSERLHAASVDAKNTAEHAHQWAICVFMCSERGAQKLGAMGDAKISRESQFCPETVGIAAALVSVHIATLDHRANPRPMTIKAGFIPLVFERRAVADSHARAVGFYEEMNERRTTRHFSSDPVPRELIELAIKTAGTAPSGAHQQPWTFVAVSEPATKNRIREAAEEEERRFYSGGAPQDWLDALAPLGTDEHKPHLTDAPWLVVLFRHAHGVSSDGSKRTYYYTQESCGIAAGFFIAAIHRMGLVTLTHTPNPMGFLAELLERPSNERAMLVMPVGYPAIDAGVPDLRRKELDEISDWKEG